MRTIKPIIFVLVIIIAFFQNVRSQTDINKTFASISNYNTKQYYKRPALHDYHLFLDSAAANDTAKTEKTMSQKMENLFKYIPVPMYSYSSEGGNLFGLAKFNSFQLSKSDTISKASILSGVASVTSKGRINVSLATQLVFNEDKFIVISYFNYKKQPEYLTKIGNTIYLDDEGHVDSIEQVTFQRLKFSAIGLYLCAKNFYAGLNFEYSNYIDIETDTNSFLVRDNAQGLNGGTDVGIGMAAAYDTRENRYTPLRGTYLISTLLFFPTSLGSDYKFTKFSLDLRKYFNPWLEHVIALQAVTNYSNLDVPFYDLSMLGGDNRMRGYYQGALRDKVLVDGQVEYRLPVWKMFGATSWIATGRTSPDYNSLSLDHFHLSVGGGFRVRVDTKNKINMRVDFGFGPHGITGTYINFTEAF